MMHNLVFLPEILADALRNSVDLKLLSAAAPAVVRAVRLPANPGLRSRIGATSSLELKDPKRASPAA